MLETQSIPMQPTQLPRPKLRKIPGGEWIGSALFQAARHRVKTWDANLQEAKLQKVQEKTLFHICKTAAETEFGKKHGFKSVKSLRDYQRNVPARPYAEFEVEIQKMKSGASDVLWPGLISYFGCSSGSSNTAAQHKFLPISLEQIGWQKKMAFDVMARYLTLTGDRSLPGGFSLGLLPPAVLKPEGPGVFVGSNPGIMLRHVPTAAKLMAIPKPPVRDIEDYNLKLKEIAKAYFDYDVRSISGTTCWFTVMFDQLLEEAKNRGRNVKSISDIWPNLNVLFGGGVYAEPYKKIIEDRVGRPIVLMDNYNATEGGIFSVTDRLQETGMLMLPDRGVFFEFVPRADHGKSNAKRIPLWEVEPDVDYSVVVTTTSGLYSYYIGDFIRFSSVYPHRMVFAGRASGMLSLTQELTSYIEIENAFMNALKREACLPVEYSASSEVGVDSTGKGRYIFFVEFEKEPADLKRFTAVVDEELCKQNRVYREHRANEVAILPPRLVVLPVGTSKEFMKALGYTSVQNKFPRIIDDSRRDLLIKMVARQPSS